MSDHKVVVFFEDRNEPAATFDENLVIVVPAYGEMAAKDLKKGDEILQLHDGKVLKIQSVVKTRDAAPPRDPFAQTPAGKDPTFKGREHMLKDPDLMLYSVMNSPEFMPRGWRAS
jgi:hypothetical protein